MLETPFERAWRTPRNPFLPETGETITSHVSGRSADIREIVMGGQSAIILIGIPRIGKTTLLRYLQRPLSAEWSWRKELEDLGKYLNLNAVHFTQINLTRLEGIADVDEMQSLFIEQCIVALQSITQINDVAYIGRKGLYDLLKRITHANPRERYFVMLDTIERLQELDMPSLRIPGRTHSAQERALALLHSSGAIRLLVELMEDFNNFGVILSIEKPPTSKIDDLFDHVSLYVSLDLARFSTMTLQTFTHDDTLQFLAQEAEAFGADWARQFRGAGGDRIFSEAEQEWLYEQAGTHPYLIQQYCFHTFDLKREYAIKQGTWTVLQKSDQDQLIERVNERVSTFLDSTWKRVKESLDTSGQDTRDMFYDFIEQSRHKSAFEQIEPEIWNRLGLEFRYILYSEGIVRYDLLQPIYYPGSALLSYLIQKAQEQNKLSTTLPQPQATVNNSQELLIAMPGKRPVHLQLSLLEYHLIKTLLGHPQKCTEEELMKAAWGKIIGKPVFTQRMHHLRKKLREYTGDEEVIENRYGGYYLLNHAEWLHLS
ncbi:MAG TPA: hypothetical protein VKR83_10580 [Ktedonobacteraceae bacterium]|nr:hypothetical protein [Ktedonobacteraceae bacterium]